MNQIGRKIAYIDLFAGAGGLSEGFSKAGFEPISHIEMNSSACQTLRTRACYYYLKQDDKLDNYYSYLQGNLTRDDLYVLVPKSILDSVICETMSDETMHLIFKSVDTSMETKGISQVDLVIGGPPCQAYSHVGRARKCMKNDPRNELYKFYFQVLNKYNPAMFVFENVLGLLTAGNGKYFEDIQTQFSSIGYTVDYKTVNASDYGVLQNRKRIILIGWKNSGKHHYPDLQNQQQKYMVSDLLYDLPAITPGGQADQYREKAVGDYLSKSGIRTEKDVLTWHVARTNLERDREIYRLAIDAWNEGKKRLQYSELPSHLITHKNTKGFLDRFKVVAGNLPASHTMMAHISKDGHYYIHPDWKQARSITVREAARIQSFPDDFYFEGSRTAAFVQIGNAVPPLMAKAIALALMEQFTKDD